MQWKSPDDWDRMKSGAECAMCADLHLDVNPFSFKVAEFEHTCVRLARNQYVRGWTLVMLKRHASELFELTDAELLGFWRDVANVAQALDRLYRPAKINYAVYGNLCPHIHCHLVLQTYASDPTKPVNTNEQEVLLSEPEYGRMIGDLQQALVSLSGEFPKFRAL